MMKRLKTILTMFILTAALQAASQPYIIDKVCLGTEMRYTIGGEPGSTYQWLLYNDAGSQVPLANPKGTPITYTDTNGATIQGNEIAITWTQAGLYKLEVVQYSANYNCDTTEQGNVEVYEQPLAIAGSPLSICSGEKVELVNGTVSNQSSLLWTTSGDGGFDDKSALKTSYNVGPGDLQKGSVHLTLTAFGLGSTSSCQKDTSTLTVTFKALPKLVINDPPADCSLPSIDLSAPSITKGSDKLDFKYFTDASGTDPLANYRAVTKEGTYYIVGTSAATGCSAIGAVKVVFDKKRVPSFASIPELCLNDPNPPQLQPSDFHGYQGTWSPAAISTATTGEFNFTFHPYDWHCAKDTTIVVKVSSSIVPVFNNIQTSYCQGDVAADLPARSLNEISGTWLPNKISTSVVGPADYIFTPDAGGCGVQVTLKITITPGFPSTFNSFQKNYCLNSTQPKLPEKSDEGFTGTWDPQVISTSATGNTFYIFTPTPGQCAQKASVPVSVNQKQTPLFDALAPLCWGSNPPEFPKEKNKIAGSWTPSAINTKKAGVTVYRFVPDDTECNDTTSIKVTVYDPIKLHLVADPLLVFGGTTNVTVTATGGTGDFISGIGSFVRHSGWQKFTVTDQANCPALDSVFIKEPQDFLVDWKIIAPSKCIGGGTNIQITPRGGTPPYRYSISGKPEQDGNMFTVAASVAPYVFEVFDANNLHGQSDPVIISDPPGKKLSVSVTSPTCFGGADGTATVTVTKALGTPTFLWDDSLQNPTKTAKATGLKAGPYKVTVTDDCGVKDTLITVSDPLLMSFTAVGVSSLCSGDNGSLRFKFTNVPNGLAYDILYDGGKFSQIMVRGDTASVAVPAGSYTNLKLLENGCSTASGVSATVAPISPITLTTSEAQPACTTPTGTSVVISPAQGTGYVYSFDNKAYQALATYRGLAPNSTHWVKVKNVKTGCESEQKSIVINGAPNPPAAPVVGTITQPSCTEATGKVNLGGLPAGNWTINPGNIKGNSSTYTIDRLNAGITYNYTVTNAAGCTSVASTDVVIDRQPSLLAAPVVGTITQPSCTEATGKVNLSGLPATGTWTVTASPGGKTISGTGTNGSFGGLDAGTYTFSVTGGITTCPSLASVNAEIKSPPVISAPIVGTITQPSCTEATGKVNLSGLPATGTWTVTASPGGKTISGTGTNASFSGLDTGTYKFTTTDAASCTSAPSSDAVIDNQPQTPAAPLVVNITQPSCPTPTGSVDIGGLPEGNWIINPGNITGNTSSYKISGLAPRSTIIYTVTNAAGCISAPAIVKIDQMPVNPQAPVASTTVKPTCNDENGTVEVSSPIGPDYEYNMDGGAYQASVIFPGVKWGNRSITVRNAITKCVSAAGSVIVPGNPPPPVLKVADIQKCLCYSGNGSISFLVTSPDPVNYPVNDGTYTIYYDGGAFINSAFSGGKSTIPVAAGTYNNLFIEANGCNSEKIPQVVVTQPAQIDIQYTVTKIDLKSQTNGAIHLIVTGGAGGYRYLWDYKSQTTPDLKDLEKGMYRVTVTDEAGCIKKDSIQIPVPNYPPVAVADNFRTSCNVVTGNVVANDQDQENDALFVDINPAVNPLHGALTLNADGTFVYVPVPGYHGNDSFVYTLYDQNLFPGVTGNVALIIIADQDHDGIPDDEDPDADGDGILNVDEVMPGQDWKTNDTDGDGIPNYLDIDSDGDGIVDNVEAQATAGYIRPSNKDANINGIGGAYDLSAGGTKIIPVDTDSDGIPDFLDSDSDNDGVPDYIEGHDANFDGKPDVFSIGKDSDADGLDDAYDTVANDCNVAGNATGSNATLSDLDHDGIPDWRDPDDDNDGIPTKFEDMNGDGDWSNDDTNFDGHPDYLDASRDCNLFVPNIFTPNGDNIHDYYQIYCISQYPNARLYIFDQTGSKIFEKIHYGNLNYWGNISRACWDGKYMYNGKVGERVAIGTYYYVLDLGNGEVKKSFVFVSY